MNATEQKIKLAQEKSIEWIELLAANSEKRLEKRLRVNHAQYAIAVKENMDDMCELLNIMERIIIEARIYKAEHKIPDAVNEIEIAIADIEILDSKTKKRQEILSKINQPAEQIRGEDKQQQDNYSQLSMF